MKVSMLLGMMLLLAWPVHARSNFPARLPNGDVFRCHNCHLNPSGGGARNAFGFDFMMQEFRWTEELAALDSDCDGLTNGEELQDVEGRWSPGTPAPGDMEAVSRPGDGECAPPGEGEGEGEGEPAPQCPEVDVGASCQTHEDCGEGGVCLEGSGGYCAVDAALHCCPAGSEDVDGDCLRSCRNDDDCADREETACTDEGFCWYVCEDPGLAPVGSPCTSDADCGDHGQCWSEAEHGFPGGYCSLDADVFCCPEGALAFVEEGAGGEDVSSCYAHCLADEGCRVDDGYLCDADETCYPQASGPAEGEGVEAESGPAEGEGEGEGEGEVVTPTAPAAGGSDGGCQCAHVGSSGFSAVFRGLVGQVLGRCLRLR